ncbi:MAG: hypothetical protein A2Y24_08345 [Clostridiales bacterium GWE2_32_10]|nr:MAG: hypothetical protein A2Y24_08345 [Clostridiales bacterium GWE2_32_10]HBY19480.1 hypothetical protein [Clostridiales bacterium]
METKFLSIINKWDNGTGKKKVIEWKEVELSLYKYADEIEEIKTEKRFHELHNKILKERGKKQNKKVYMPDIEGIIKNRKQTYSVYREAMDISRKRIGFLKNLVSQCTINNENGKTKLDFPAEIYFTDLIDNLVELDMLDLFPFHGEEITVETVKILRDTLVGNIDIYRRCYKEIHHPKNYMKPAFTEVSSKCEKVGTCLCDNKGGSPLYNASCLTRKADKGVLSESRNQENIREKAPTFSIVDDNGREISIEECLNF